MQRKTLMPRSQRSILGNPYKKPFSTEDVDVDVDGKERTQVERSGKLGDIHHRQETAGADPGPPRKFSAPQYQQHHLHVPPPLLPSPLSQRSAITIPLSSVNILPPSAKMADSGMSTTARSIASPQMDMMSMEEFDRRYPYKPHLPGEYGSVLNNLFQVKGLVPHFAFSEPRQARFYGTLKIDGELVGEVGPCASKKSAKEELCKICISKVEAMQNRKKRKSVGEDELPEAPDVLKSENWIGTLIEHCQQSKIDYPVYSETAPHPSQGPFSCSVHFSGSPPGGFGATAAPFKVKADAKKNAAMEAVVWLRSQGLLVGGASNKRRRSSANDDEPTGTGLTSEFDHSMDLDPDKSVQTVGKQAQDLCFQLGLTSPAFEFAPLHGASVNAWVVFIDKDVRAEPRLAGRVAPVFNVYGKKAAKEQCWSELLKVLKEIRASR